MATVYLAHDLRHDRPVAIKIVRPELSHAVVAERFLREIWIEARLTHPHIITMLDSGVLELGGSPPRPYYVMPYVPGESLRQRLDREGALPLDDAIRIACQVAEALEYAHQRGVVHRDIKPENILLVEHRAVVADFGIARVRSTSGPGGAETSAGMALGTPHYMSPEQWAAEARLDGRTDIYSLGCVVYEALSGEPPFTGPTVEAIRARHATEPMRSLRTVRPGVPEHVEVALQRALAKVPADRFRTAAEFAAALQGSGAALARTPTRPSRHRVVPWAAAIAALALAATFLAWTLILRPRPGLDRNRFVVLPFQQRPGAPPLLSGDAVARELRRALGRWEDITVVAPLVLADAMGQGRPPQSLREALELARRLGAAQLVWGEVWSSGDTTYVQAGLHDAARPRWQGRTHTIALAGPTPSHFSALADSVIITALGSSPGAALGLVGTASLEALRAWAAGDSALTEWDLDGADSLLKQALALDPAYPQANLRYAELLQWRFRPPGEWQRYAETAVRGANQLSLPDRRHATALLLLSQGRYPESCGQYRAILARDSLDFAAWFGLGECQARDSVVVPDPGSPSGWRFRSSYHNAITAYTQALRLVPSVHRAYQGAAFDRLQRLLYTETGRYRLGFADGSASAVFGAYPALSADTLAFVPFPLEQVRAGQAAALPETRHAAVSRNRARLREVAESWIRAYPARLPALALWARALEVAGDPDAAPAGLPTALEAVREIRVQARGRAEAEGAALDEVRLLVKSGRFAEARALADSLLDRGPIESSNTSRFASLAALNGRVHRAVDLLEQSATDWTPMLPDRRPVAVPAPLRRTALRLLGYAVFGIPADSVRVLERRLYQEAVRHASSSERTQVLLALLHEPSVHAWDLLERPTEAGYLEPALAGLRAQRGEDRLLAVRRIFAVIDSARRGQRAGEVSLDRVYQESRILLAAGDSIAALDRLGRELEDPATLDRRLLDQYPQAASVARAMVLAAELAAATGRQEQARRWAQAVVALWERADPELQPTVRQMRRLAAVR
jgi:tetratricopeptide (TPR) repeat protein